MATRGAPPAAGIPAKVASAPPNQTLYVTNIPSNKIKKEDLRTELYLLFSTFGSVLDIVALKTMKMRGQAHIVYKDIQTATQAMRALDGFEFFGFKLKITYAKGRSNIISKLDGTFKPPITSTGAAVEVTDLQQSIFSAPVPGAPVPALQAQTGEAPTAAKPDLPSKPTGTDSENRGLKRTRDEEEEDESDSDVAMEEDSDDE